PVYHAPLKLQGRGDLIFRFRKSPCKDNIFFNGFIVLKVLISLLYLLSNDFLQLRFNYKILTYLNTDSLRTLSKIMDCRLIKRYIMFLKIGDKGIKVGHNKGAKKRPIVTYRTDLVN